MVKELNNMKNKKSNSYKPYDTSNSFVRRVTSRVTQLLPQPTSWLSRFLAREPEQAGPVESQEGEDEEILQPPPSKRMRTVQTCTDFPLHQNSLGLSEPRRIEEKREEELSPIRSYKFSAPSGPIWREDQNVPGPSGLSRHRFVASTPAVLPESHTHQAQQPKVNGDDGSDSDSGSHASSLQPEVQPSQSLFRTLNLKQPRPCHRNAAEELNNSLLRSKQLKLDVSSSSLSSSRGRVSFDTTVFNSPFKGRLCGGLSVSRDESMMESPFYRSNTTFGGASSCNDSLLRTRSLHSEVPIVVQPSQSHRVSDNLGSSTKKILKALEQFSTPMLDQSRRIQPRDRGVKRKSEVPYKELVIPQMPDLLRIKRRDARHARQSSAMTSTSFSSTSNTPVTVVPSTKPSAAETAASESSSSQLSQRLGKFGDSCKDKLGTSTDKRVEDKKVRESPSLITGLPLTSLPKFDSGLVKQQPASVNTSVSPAPVTLKPTPSQFTFSKPIDVAISVTPCSSIPLSKIFSQPLDPNSKMCDTKSVVNCVNATQSKGAEMMTYSPPSNSKLKKKESTFTTKPVAKTSELKTGSVLDFLNKKSSATPSVELKSGSVMDVLKSGQEPIKKQAGGAKWQCNGCYVSNEDSRTKCAACEQPRKQLTQPNNTSQGFGDKFKITSNEWECKSCFVRNNVKDIKCLACDQNKPDAKTNVKTPAVEHPKTNVLQPLSGFGDKFKPPAGSWECSACLVQNKSGDLKCISCSTDKPGASSQSSSVTTAAPLTNLFKKPEGSWECDTCLVRNKSEDSLCVSCGSLKKGAKPPSQPASTFSFGIPPSSSAPSKFSFGVSSTSTSESSVKSTAFTSTLVPSTQTATPTFTFGIPSSAPENKTSKSPISNSMFSSLTNTNSVDGKTKVTENSKTEAENVLKSEQPFTFGVPNKESGPTAAVAPIVKSIFGNVTTSSVSTPSTSSSVTPNATSSALPIFVNQISSTKSPIVVSVEKTSAPAPNPIFTFGSSSTSLSTLGKSGASENTKPTETSIVLFGSNENDVNPMVTSPVPKGTASNAIGGTENNVTDAKTNMFTFGSSSAVEKKPFLNSNTGETPTSVFSTSTVNSFSTPSTSAPVKPVFTFNSGFSAVADANQIKPNTTVNSFSSQPIQHQSTAPEGGFNFKPSEPAFTFTQKKTESSTAPFQFGSTTSNHTNNFNSAAPATNQFNSGFGAAASSPFSTQASIFGSSAPQPAQTASFLFGASQTNDRPPPAPTFNFAAQSGSNNVGNTSVAGGFAFGQTPSSTPVQPPAFDPNVKPVFNFSGGQTPIFSATAAPGAATGEERKIRKAFRRTTQK